MRRVAVHAARLVAAYMFAYAALSMLIVWGLAASAPRFEKIAATKAYARSMFLPGQGEVSDGVFVLALLVAIIFAIVWWLVDRRRARAQTA